MKAKELIDVLSLNPEAEISSIRSWYNGDSDQYEAEKAVVVTNGEEFIIVPNDLYMKAEAIGTLTGSINWGMCFEAAKEDSAIIYVD